jgi:hypothetical protein
MVGVSIATAGAIVVRGWFVLAYRPAFLGFSDTGSYLLAAARNIFRDPQHPAGYPFFLRLVHHLTDQLSFVILLQHTMGVAAGLLLYKSVRRLGVPPWLGLLPAAVVYFNGTGLFLEHSPLADPLLVFLQAVGIYAVVRSLEHGSVRWSVTAGIATGVSFWVKTVALSSAILVPFALLLLVDGKRRERLAAAAGATAGICVLVFAYVGAQAYFTGRWGYERQDAWNLYARVSTFADCSRFAPPRGTAFLCPAEPPSARQPPNYFQYDRRSPAVKRFGPPSVASQAANGVLERFSLAAIEHEPVAYVAAILRSLSYYVFPRAGEGYSPEALKDALLDTPPQHTGNSSDVQSVLALLYPSGRGLRRSAGAVRSLSWYEAHTRIEGALLIALVAAALAGALLLRGRARSGAIFFGLTALLSIALAVATNSYDARYAYPTFGPLAASAALGGWALARLLRRVWQRSGAGQIARASRNSGVAGC